jgi:MSHA biogenesis protein MshJ
MKRYWDIVQLKIDGMTLRERALIFAAAGFLVISLINSLLLDPLLSKQKILSSQVIQQQEQIKALQAAMESLLKARRDDQNSPLRMKVAQLKQQLEEQDSYLQSRRDRLVEPEKMAKLLQNVLGKNGRLQLVELKTLPLSLLIEDPLTIAAKKVDTLITDADDKQTQLYKHGVQITVRGGYLDLLRYVAALEKMPVQMFWGDVTLNAGQYPDSVLTLTLYTLSLDEKWLTV